MLKHKTLSVISSLMIMTNATAAFSFERDDRLRCDNPEIIAQVLEHIEAYQQANPANSVVEKRRRGLLLKNLNTFTPENPDGFTNKNDFLTANRLIMLKINDGYKNEDFTLCKSSGDGQKYNIYLLMYPQENAKSKVEIINFLPPEKSGETFDFEI